MAEGDDRSSKEQNCGWKERRGWPVTEEKGGGTAAVNSIRTAGDQCPVIWQALRPISALEC